MELYHNSFHSVQRRFDAQAQGLYCYERGRAIRRSESLPLRGRGGQGCPMDTNTRVPDQTQSVWLFERCHDFKLYILRNISGWFLFSCHVDWLCCPWRHPVRFRREWWCLQAHKGGWYVTSQMISTVQGKEFWLLICLLSHFRHVCTHTKDRGHLHLWHHHTHRPGLRPIRATQPAERLHCQGA